MMKGNYFQKYIINTEMLFLLRGIGQQSVINLTLGDFLSASQSDGDDKRRWG